METQHEKTIIRVGESGFRLHAEQPEMAMEATGQRHIIFLHGWNSHGRDMQRIKQAVMPGIQAIVWSPDYDSNNFSFTDCARLLADSLLKQKQFDFSRTMIIGYSMGGIVARQMINNGFPCKALVTLCSPHAGIMYPLGSDTGSMSLIPASQDLNRLNRMENYARLYHCIGIYSRDSFGDHRDDGVVGIDSALAKHLWPVAYTSAIQLQYEGGGAWADPHQHGMNPESIPGAVQYCRQLASRI